MEQASQKANKQTSKTIRNVHVFLQSLRDEISRAEKWRTQTAGIIHLTVPGTTRTNTVKRKIEWFDCKILRK